MRPLEAIVTAFTYLYKFLHPLAIFAHLIPKLVHVVSPDITDVKFLEDTIVFQLIDTVPYLPI